MSSGSRNEDDLFGEGIRITENLLFAGLLEGRWTGENNFNLNDNRARDRQDTEGSARARLIYRPSATFIGVAELRYRGLDRDDDEDGNTTMMKSVSAKHLHTGWKFKWNLDLQAGASTTTRNANGYMTEPGRCAVFHFNRYFVTEFSVSTTFPMAARDQHATTRFSMFQMVTKTGTRGVRIHRDYDLLLTEKLTHYGIRAMASGSQQ